MTTAQKPATAIRVAGPVALIGGGELRPEEFSDVLARAHAVVAADSGANHFEPGGAPRLDALIGDMDSVADLAGWRREPSCTVIERAEQDTTDFEKCLYSVAAPLYLAAGFFGRRVDHLLGVFHTLLRRSDKTVVLLGAEDVAFLAPQEWRCRLWPGARVSIVPLAPCEGRASEGLRWPIDGLAFELGRQSGTSNEALAADIRLGFDRRGALILLERAALDPVIDSLRAGRTG